MRYACQPTLGLIGVTLEMQQHRPRPVINSVLTNQFVSIFTSQAA